MADSFRLAVLKSITAHLATDITTGNGYAVDVGGRVYRGRIRIGQDDVFPMVSILEGVLPDQFPERPADPVQDESTGEQKSDWDLLFQGWAEDDKEHPTDPAHQLLACIKQSLFKLARRAVDDREQLLADNSPLYAVVSVSIGPGVVRPAIEPTEKTICWLRVTVSIVETMSDLFHT